MTGHGDLYYENKEYEYGSGVKDRKPGNLSSRLLEALGVTPGSKMALNPALFCPPWLINQQRYGPPPSYPNLKIPGLNAPIPVAQGAQFGYHSGGWGKPPVDEYGQPIYGDVFGVISGIDEGEEVMDRSHWGEMEIDGDTEEVEEADDSEDEAEAEAALAGIQGAGATPSSYKDIVADTSGWTTDPNTGLPVPPKPQGAESNTAASKHAGDVDAYLSKGTVDLRKRLAGEATEDAAQDEAERSAQKQLYTVVKEVDASAQHDPTVLFGSAVTYNLGKEQQSTEVAKDAIASSVEKNSATTTEGEGNPKKKRMRVENTLAAQKLSNFKF